MTTALLDLAVYHSISTNHAALLVAGVLVVGVSLSAAFKIADARRVAWANKTHLGMEGE